MTTARRGQHGSAMILTLVIILMVVGVSGAFLAVTAYRGKAQFASIQADEAQVICDSALDKVRRALWRYRTDQLEGKTTWEWDNILRYCANLGAYYGTNANGASLATDPATILADYRKVAKAGTQAYDFFKSRNASAGGTTVDEAPVPGDETNPDPSHLVFIGWNRPFSEGAYQIVVRDNQDEAALVPAQPDNPFADIDNQVFVTVTATLPDGTQRQIEGLLRYRTGVFDPDTAILTNGTLKLNGNPDVVGSKGSVHANDDMDVSGNPTVAKDATASGSLKVSGNPNVGGTLSGGKPEKPVPPIVPNAFKSYADYLMTSAGQVYDNRTHPPTLLVADGKKSSFFGWEFTGSSGWQLSGNTAPPPATYYFETKVKVSGNPGSAAVPARMTLISDASINISGNPTIQPYLQDVAMIAGTDLQISGNPDHFFQGLYGAREQVKLNGNPDIRGAVIAENMADTDNEVKDDPSVQVSGNPRITYNGGLRTMLSRPSSVTLENVRKLK